MIKVPFSPPFSTPLKLRRLFHCTWMQANKIWHNPYKFNIIATSDSGPPLIFPKII